MSKFHRSGHYRTNSYGTRYWVSGHTVDRSDFDYNPLATKLDPGRIFSELARQKRNSNYVGRTSASTIPNANCPECGASVYFYQNDLGSGPIKMLA
jgi:hypothetical protein